MYPLCRFTLISRCILRFGWSVPSTPLWNPQDHKCAHRTNHRPLKWMQSVGSHYIPDLYFAFDYLFPSSLLRNPQDYYCAHRPNLLPLQMNTICMFLMYTSLRIFCSIPRLCETHRFITELTEQNTRPCKWIQSVGSHYVSDLYIASDCLFPFSLLWFPEVHYCAHRPKHRRLQMNPVCRLTLCSRSILRFEWSVPFLAFVKPTC
jgi:hypothetical protein